MVGLVLLLASASAGPECRAFPKVDAHLAELPSGWPSYPGRCLDQGSPDETLLERARRCALEEPEDDDVMRVLGVLGDDTDVPRLEAIAHAGAAWVGARDALSWLQTPEARRAYDGVVCHGPGLYRHTGTGPPEVDPPLEGLTPPTFSRARTPTRDAAELAAWARKELQQGDARKGLAILGWVGDSADLERILAHPEHGMIEAVAALGSEQAVQWLIAQAERRQGPPYPWYEGIGASRTPEAWDWLIAHPSPPAHAAWLAMRRPEAVRAVLAWRPVHPLAEIPDEQLRAAMWEHNVAAHSRGGWSDIAALQAGTVEADGIGSLVAHPGRRWLVVEALPDLPEALREHAVKLLVRVDWGEEEPPDFVVQQRRAEQDRLQAELRTVLDPQSGPSTGLLRRALQDDVLRQQVAPLVRDGAYGLKPCEEVDVLAHVEVDHDVDWLVDRIGQCGRRQLHLDPAVAIEVRDALLEQGRHANAFTVTPDAVRPLRRALKRRDRRAQLAALGHLEYHGPIEALVEEVAALTRSEDVEVRRVALTVLALRAPERAVPALASHLDHPELEEQAVTLLLQIHSEEALELLVPRLDDPAWAVQVARALNDQEIHHDKVDAILGVSWEEVPGEPVDPARPGPDGTRTGQDRHLAKVRVRTSSPDGRAALTGDDDGVRFLWHADGTRIELARPDLPPQQARVGLATFSADGSRVATRFEAGPVEVHDVATGERLLHVERVIPVLGPHLAFEVAPLAFGETCQGLDAALSADGSELFTAARRGDVSVVRRWTVDTGQVLQTWTFDEGACLLPVQPDGRVVVHAGAALLALGEGEPEVLGTEVRAPDPLLWGTFSGLVDVVDGQALF